MDSNAVTQRYSAYLTTKSPEDARLTWAPAHWYCSEHARLIAITDRTVQQMLLDLQLVVSMGVQLHTVGFPIKLFPVSADRYPHGYLLGPRFYAESVPMGMSFLSDTGWLQFGKTHLVRSDVAELMKDHIQLSDNSAMVELANRLQLMAVEPASMPGSLNPMSWTPRIIRRIGTPATTEPAFVGRDDLLKPRFVYNNPNSGFVSMLFPYRMQERVKLVEDKWACGITSSVVVTDSQVGRHLLNMVEALRPLGLLLDTSQE